MDQRRRFYIISAAIIFILIIFAVYLTKDFLSTILLSFFLAYILDPVFMYLSRHVGHHRRASALVSMLIIFFILISIFFVVANALIEETSNLLGLGGIAYLQTQSSNFSSIINGLANTYLPASGCRLPEGDRRHSHSPHSNSPTSFAEQYHKLRLKFAHILCSDSAGNNFHLLLPR